MDDNELVDEIAEADAAQLIRDQEKTNNWIQILIWKYTQQKNSLDNSISVFWWFCIKPRFY